MSGEPFGFFLLTCLRFSEVVFLTTDYYYEKIKGPLKVLV